MSNNCAEEGTGTNDDTGQNGTTEPARNDSNRRQLRSDELGKQLLPGLPNDITIDLITPKLPWKEIVSTMSSVSRTWQCAIRSHEVYDARVRCHSTEEFVIIKRYLFRPVFYHSIGLYSPREKKSCYLPPIPHLRRGFPYFCQCLSLHGKIYILGGEDEFHEETKMGLYIPSKKVYVLDLYGQRQWKECASMEYRRKKFGCGVLDGKIYVFGGNTIGEHLRESEMYDPEVDAWFPISSLHSFRAQHQVATVGDELFVYGGNFYEEISENGGEDDSDILSGDSLWEAFCLDMYNPAIDCWSCIDPFQRDEERQQVVYARGKFYAITQFDIHVYDMGNNSWTFLHTCSFPTIDSVVITPLSPIAVDNELLLRVSWFNTERPGASSCLLQSRGFGSDTKRIVWENAKGSPSLRDLSGNFVECFMTLAEL